MDAIEVRFGSLYSVLLGLVALGSCLALGPEGTTWDTGGAVVAIVVAVGLMLAWAAVVPRRLTWPLGVLAGTAVVGAFVVAAESDEGPFGTGGQLLVVTFALTCLVALGHLAAVRHLVPRPQHPEHRSEGAA